MLETLLISPYVLPHLAIHPFNISLSEKLLDASVSLSSVSRRSTLQNLTGVGGGEGRESPDSQPVSRKHG